MSQGRSYAFNEGESLMGQKVTVSVVAAAGMMTDSTPHPTFWHTWVAHSQASMPLRRAFAEHEGKHRIQAQRWTEVDSKVFGQVRQA